MANLFPSSAAGIALGSPPMGGSAEFTVDVTGSTPKVEIWERVLTFTPGTPIPQFTHGGIFSSNTVVTRPVPIGGIYQVRLFREGQGTPTLAGDLLGKLDFPCVNPEGRADFLTRCAETPQIDITTGGTFVSVTFGSSASVRARIQLGVNPPTLDATGLPFFLPDDMIASAVTNEPKLLSKTTLIDELLQRDTHAHTSMTTDQPIFFVIFAWNTLGYWDFVWNTTGIAPATPPELIKTLQRVVDVRLAKLVCLDDSDDLSDGEATFKFQVKHATGTEERTVTWNPMATGSTLMPPGGAVHLDPPKATGIVTVRVEGHEDDSNSFPPDDDDLAAFPLGLTSADGRPLPFPVGEGSEQVNNRLLVGTSQPLTDDNSFSFQAHIIYSVKYI